MKTIFKTRTVSLYFTEQCHGTWQAFKRFKDLYRMVGTHLAIDHIFNIAQLLKEMASC